MDQQQLQSVLSGLCDHVYFQPPANVQIEYPAIVYKRDDLDTKFAENRPYTIDTRYQVQVIDRSPEGEITYLVAQLPKTSFLRNFVIENLHHDVFLLYA
jgi:hypothetical protein